MPRRARAIAPAVLALALLPVLTACFPNPFFDPQQAAEDAIEEATGGDVDYVQGELPQGFPEAAVPLADGELGMGVYLGGGGAGGWQVTVTPADVDAAIATLRADFEAAGYATVNETTGANYSAVFSGTEYLVQVNRDGDGLTYRVGAPSGTGAEEPAE